MKAWRILFHLCGIAALIAAAAWYGAGLSGLMAESEICDDRHCAATVFFATLPFTFLALFVPGLLIWRRLFRRK